MHALRWVHYQHQVAFFDTKMIDKFDCEIIVHGNVMWFIFCVTWENIVLPNSSFDQLWISPAVISAGI